MLQNTKFIFLTLTLFFLFSNFLHANTDLAYPAEPDRMNSDTTFTCDTCFAQCFDIPFMDVADYEFSINGEVIPSEELSPCDLDTSYAYSYFTLTGMGNQGPYQLSSWSINGTEVTNGETFNNPQELATLLSQLDPQGSWSVDPSFFIAIGGVAGNNYSSLVIINISDSNSVSTLPTNLVTTGNGSALCIPYGNNAVSVTEISTGNIFDSFDIYVEGILDINYTVNSESCNANGNIIHGSITTSVEGGVSPYTYFWQGSNGYSSTDKDILNLSPGTYNLTVTDANGCSTPVSNLVVNSINCNPEIYVDQMATGGNNDGSSWADAFLDLQDALAATDGFFGTIYVAQGTYLPTDNALRGESFRIPENTTILGGYPTGGGNPKPDLYKTILSGEIDGIAGHAGNSFNVVKVINVTRVILDGLFIEKGNANSSTAFVRARGGGIFCSNSDLTIVNTVVQNNKAIYGGGLFATLSPKLVLTDTDLKLNQSDYGSALYCSNQTKAYLSRVEIVENNSLVRCAVEINNSTYTSMKNVLIADNGSDKANALALIATNRDQICDIENSTIIGGPTNRFLIVTQIGFGDQLDLNINNSIVAHQELSFSKNVNAVNNNIFNFNHNNCYFQGTSVIGNGTATLFSGIDGDLLLNSDFSVDKCSPVVNAGNNVFVSSFIDLIENTRISDGLVDIGAYENQSTCSANREFVSLTKEKGFSIQPNPANNFIQLDIAEENIDVRILDFSGKEVLASTAKTIGINHLPKGVYLIRVYTQNGLLGTEKMMKL